MKFLFKKMHGPTWHELVELSAPEYGGPMSYFNDFLLKSNMIFLMNQIHKNMWKSNDSRLGYAGFVGLW
jgi:hypothetical protein